MQPHEFVTVVAEWLQVVPLSQLQPHKDHYNLELSGC